MSYVLQNPGTTVTHSIDWASWLATSDSVASGSWEITPTGPTVIDLGEEGAVISVDVSDLTRGVIYRLTCSMVSAAGEKPKRSIAIRCDHQ